MIEGVAVQVQNPRSVEREVAPWIRACIAGELIGFIPPSLAGALLVALGASEQVLIAGLVVAGAAEGAILGRYQARVVKSWLPGVTGWAVVTSVAAAFAWLAGMGGSSLVQNHGVRAMWIAVPAWAAGLAGMGGLQAWRLSGHVRSPGRWIPITALAWMVGVAIPVAALSVVPNDWPPPVHVVVGVAAAVAMGATVGIITGRTLLRMLAVEPE